MKQKMTEMKILLNKDMRSDEQFEDKAAAADHNSSHFNDEGNERLNGTE